MKKELLNDLKKEGLSKNDPDSKFDKDQLADGIKIEIEHTTDREIAKEIAKDHLVEDEDYYKKLAKIEGKKTATKGKCTEKDVVQFLRDYPNPTDERLHRFAKERGFEVDEVERIAYKMATKYVKDLSKSNRKSNNLRKALDMRAEKRDR